MPSNSASYNRWDDYRWRNLKLAYYRAHDRVCSFCGLDDKNQIALHHTSKRFNAGFWDALNPECFQYLTPLCFNHHQDLHRIHDQITKSAGREKDLHAFTKHYVAGIVDPEYIEIAKLAKKKSIISPEYAIVAKKRYFKIAYHLRCHCCDKKLNGKKAKFGFYTSYKKRDVDLNIWAHMLILCQDHKDQLLQEFDGELSLDPNVSFLNFVNRYSERWSMLLASVS